jgi:phage terminase Nu1 subunit (DNA packaging protein)
MHDMNRQQLCAALGISESTVRRLELSGMPYTPVGKRAKRYNLAEVKQWLRANQGQITTTKSPPVSASWPTGNVCTEAFRKVHLRVMPS